MSSRHGEYELYCWIVGGNTCKKDVKRERDVTLIISSKIVLKLFNNIIVVFFKTKISEKFE